MVSMNKQYEYIGPVYQFETCIMREWKASTWARSEKKARSNLAFRYKRDNNLTPGAKIVLPGKIIKKGD